MAELRKELPNFDTLMELANRDPDGLEHLRSSLIRDFIDQAPDNQRQRLQGLQFTIDMERRKAKNPVQSCMRMSQMMHERVTDLCDSLNDFSTLTAVPPVTPSRPAKVIPLRPRSWEDETDDS
ncbi:DUF3135 domain-containing protein [Saccharospirillum mangrovi]|uniref:DUF3135 domain-containing protein n=1 Tax=Saccharospirillum mangrovi TaxID=2161747 RepID=UPI000D3D0E60|nr:DUF3135 domain-containing protein [Saccharospirillum mangrovi]